MLTAKDADAAERSCVEMRIAVLAEAHCAVTSAFFDGALSGISQLGFEVYVMEFIGVGVEG
jgi:hypothetical protein